MGKPTAAGELADPDHPSHAVVRRDKERIRKWLQVRAEAAGAAQPTRLSRQLMLVFAGVQSEALLERSSRPAREARELARILIDAADPQLIRPSAACGHQRDPSWDGRAQPG